MSDDDPAVGSAGLVLSLRFYVSIFLFFFCMFVSWGRYCHVCVMSADDKVFSVTAGRIISYCGDQHTKK